MPQVQEREVKMVISFFCVLGLVYTAVLFLCSYNKGLLFMWFFAVIILFASGYLGWWEEIDGVYKLNSGNGFPPWIFTPEIFFVSPLVASIFRYAVWAQKRDNERRYLKEYFLPDEE
jgi:hypothetical protein